jgi:hypothetical protein
MLMRAKLGMRMLALLAAVLLRQVPLAWTVKLVLHTVQLVALLQVVQPVGQAVQPG